MRIQLLPIILILLFSFEQQKGHAQILDTLQIQWDSLPSPPEGIFKDYFRRGNELYATTNTDTYASVHKSLDNGETWTEFIGGDSIALFCATENYLYYTSKNPFSFDDTNVALYRLDNDGNETMVRHFSTNITVGMSGGGTQIERWFIEDLKITNDSILSYSTYKQIWNVGPGGGNSGADYEPEFSYSFDEGINWQTLPARGISDIKGDSIIIHDRDYGWIFKLGENYNLPLDTVLAYPSGPGIGDPKIITWQDNAITLYANGNSPSNSSQLYPYQTIDYGVTWTELDFPFDFFGNNLKFDFSSNHTVIGSTIGVFRSTNQQTNTFEKIYDGEVSGKKIDHLRVIGEEIYANTNTGATLYSPNLGEDWEVRNWGLGDMRMETVFLGEDSLFVLGNYKKWHKWHRNEQIWRTVPHDGIGGTMTKFNGDWYGSSPLSRSEDGGGNWIDLSANPNGCCYNHLFTQGGVIYGSRHSTSFSGYSEDGENWGQFTLPGERFAVRDEFILLIQENEVKRSVDFGQTWTTVFTYPEDLSSVFVHQGHFYIFNQKGGLFKSENNGNTWIQTGANLFSYDNDYSLKTVYLTDSLIWFYSGGIHVSKNDGLNWHWIKNPGPFSNTRGVFQIGEHIYFTTFYSFHRVSEFKLLDEIEFLESHAALLTGQYFIDLNEDCAYNAGDIGLANKPIQLNPQSYNSFTHNDGSFAMQIPAGDYELTLDTLAYHAYCTPDSLFQISLSPNDTLHRVIGLQPISGIYDLGVWLTLMTAARPGFDVKYQVAVRNGGTEPVSPVLLHFVFPSDIMTPFDLPSNAAVVGDTILITIDEIPLYSNASFCLNFNLSAQAPLGNQLETTVAISNTYNDQNLGDNEADVKATIRGSYDPNDKQLLPENTVLAGEEWLEYLIRFQNTGTDTAFTVEVRDTLQLDAFDSFSFEMLDASHGYEVSLRDNRILTWIFDDILLPDSTTNEPESHGFVRFRLMPKDTLFQGETIRNSAGIYFDFNEPVITNTVVSEVEKQQIVFSQSATICEGDSYEGTTYFESEMLADTMGNWLIDTINIITLTVLPEYEIQIDTAIQAGDLIQSIAIYSDTVLVQNLTTQLGCDSTILTNVFILTATGSKELLATDIELLPNPATDFVLLQTSFKYPFKGELLLTDINGRVLYKQSSLFLDVGLQKMIIDLANLPVGTYVVLLKEETRVWKKILIKME